MQRFHLFIALGVAQLCLWCVIEIAHSGPMVFPGKDWDKASPESQFVDSALLNMAVDYLVANAPPNGDGADQLVITRNGFMIWEGPTIDSRHNVYSVTKSITSTMLGLLIDDGKASLDTLAMDYVPSMSTHYPGVTLRHFATMTSGYRGVGEDPQGWWTETPFTPDEAGIILNPSGPLTIISSSVRSPLITCERL